MVFTAENGVSNALVLKMRGVSLLHDSDSILENIDMELQRGEIHALVGGADAAKSGLCSIAAGEIAPSGGEVTVWYGRLAMQARKKIMERGIIKVPKTAQLFPHLTVSQNLVAGNVRDWWDNWRQWRSKNRSIRKWIDHYGIRLPFEQPLAHVPRENWLYIQILNLLFRRPRLLILDETLELLPPEQRGRIWPILHEQAKEGMTVLWATQNLDDAISYSTRISVLGGKRMLFANATKSIDRLALFRICYGRLSGDGNTTLEQFNQMLSFTEAALRDLPTAIVVVDREQNLRFFNQSASDLFLGMPPGVTGVPLGDLRNPVNRQLVDLVSEAIAEGKENNCDVEWQNMHYSAEFENRLVDIRVRHISEAETRIGFLVVIEDVSVREEMQRQLVLSENMASIGLLAAGVAHEINNPLAIIGNYNRFLKGKVDGEGPKEAVDQIDIQSKRIEQIVRNLTAISSGRVSNKVSINLFALAEELCQLTRADSRTSKVEFTCAGPEKPSFILADPNEIRLIILNLLRNAVEAIGGAKGEIRLEVTSGIKNDGNFIRMTVRDNGPGIEMSDPNHIFLPFVSNKKGKGIHQGIGLSIVHKIIEKYHGTISVENPVDGGCLFTITLPCSDFIDA